MSEVVFQGEVSVPITIFKYEVDGEDKFDYYDSDQWFDTLEDAIRSFEDSVNGHLVE